MTPDEPFGSASTHHLQPCTFCRDERGRPAAAKVFRGCTRDVAGGKLGTNQSDELKERGYRYDQNQTLFF